MAAEPTTTAPSLLRALGLKEAIALHMGVIIGSGIFIVPATIARERPAVGPILVAWLFAGLLTLFGALSLADLSALLPEASFFYAMAALAVIVPRRALPDAPRPYRAWGYPWATLLFAVAAGGFLWNTLREDPRDAVIGLGLLLLGLPFYVYWSRRSAPEVAP